MLRCEGPVAFSNATSTNEQTFRVAVREAIRDAMGHAAVAKIRDHSSKTLKVDAGTGRVYGTGVVVI